MQIDLSKSLTKFLPVNPSEKRPLWSVMIPVYNNTSFLSQLLERVLSQYKDSDQMEIFVIDDCSVSGDPESVVYKFGKGIVKYFRQPQNVGHSKNYDTCIKKAKGKYIHILHQDDLIREGFYARMEKSFNDNPDIGAAFCRHIFIDEKGNWLWISELEKEEDGILDNWLMKIAEKQRIQYASMVVKRKVYEDLGGFVNKETAGEGWEMAGEDWEMWVRIAAKYRVGYVTEPLAEYRIHRASMTSSLAKSGQNVKDIHRIIDIFSQYIPEDKKDLVKKSAAKHYANYTFENSKKILQDTDDPAAAEAQLNEALKLDPEIYSRDILLYSKLKDLIKLDGISIVLTIENDADGVKDSLDEISSQLIPEGIKTEIIFVDNGSTDNTYQTAKKLISNDLYKGSSVKLIRQEYSDFNSALKTAFSKAEFENILVCNGRFKLSSDFLATGYKIFKEDKNAALIRSSADIYTDGNLPSWINDKLLNCRFRIDKKGFRNDSDPFLINGSFIRKSVWGKILDEGIIPDLSGIVNKSVSIESELPDLLIKIGFKTVKANDLVYKKYIPIDSLKYSEFRDYFENEGRISAGSRKGNIEIRRALRLFRKFNNAALQNNSSENSQDINLIYARYYSERLKSLLNNRTLNKIEQTFLLRSLSRISDHKLFRNDFRQFYKEPARKGVSVIINIRDHKNFQPVIFKQLSGQITKSYVDPEVIVTVNNSDENKISLLSDNIKSEWKKYSNRELRLNILNFQEEHNSFKLKKAIENSANEFLIFFEDDEIPELDFLQNAVNLLRSNDHRYIAGGYVDIQFESEPPEWFERFSRYFFDHRTPLISPKDINSLNNIRFSNGLVINKKSAEKLIDTELSELDSTGNIFSTSKQIQENDFRLSSDLKLKKYFTKEEITWDNLRTIWRNNGIKYQIEFDKRSEKESAKIPFQLRKTLNDLRKCGYKNLLSYNKTHENNLQILQIEYNLGKLDTLLNQKTQNPKRQIRLIKKGARKKDHRYLLKLTNGISHKVERKGVSVIICCYNSAKLLPVTLEYMSRQKTKNYVDWEVVVVNNNSSDNTSEVAAEEWRKYPECKGQLRIVNQPVPGLSAAREKGIETSKYEYMVFCDDDNWLQENFVQNVVSVMRSNPEIGIAGSETQEVCEVEPPEWFHKWKNWSYAVGEQFERAGDITWSRGFVWGAGMVLRREALNQLYNEGFKSLLTDRKGKELASGGDTELCYALRLAGWRIWYAPDLKLKHYMTAPRLKWDYFLKLWKGFGVSTAGLDTYLNVIPSDMIEGNYVTVKKSWEENYKDTQQKLKDFGKDKVKNYQELPEGDPDVPLIVFNLARQEELKRIKDLYKKRIEETDKANWKRDFQQLRLKNKKYKVKSAEDKTVWPWVDQYDEIDNENITEDLKISILTPSYLSEDKIEKAIQSVIRQGYKNYEHIVVDGGSNDNTVNILKKYPHITWVSEKDKGQSDAMNRAFEMSTGDLICYLNSDDFFEPGAFAKVVKEFNLHKEIDMVVGNLILDMKEGPMIIYPEKDYKKIMLSFYYSFPINPVSYFYKREVQEKTGKFPLDNHYTMDYWFLLKAYKNFKIHKVEEILGTFVFHDVNKTSSADNLKNTHMTMIGHLKENDPGKYLYYFYNYYNFKLFNKRSYRSQKSVTRYLRPKYIKSVRFGKDYSEHIYKKAYDKCYHYSYLKALTLLMMSGVAYPPHIFKKSRRSLFYRSILGHSLVEKFRNYYYKGIVKKYEVKESLKNKLKLKNKPDTLILKSEADKKNIFSLMFSGKAGEYSDVIFNIAKDYCYNYRYLKGFYFFSKSVMIRPDTIFRKSRRSLFIRIILGHRNTEILREKYYSTVVKRYTVKSGIKNKVNSKFNYNSKNKIKYSVRDLYHYFRYRKFKARSKELYDKARITFSNNDNSKTIKLLIPSFFLYPPSLFKRNKLSLFINSLKSGSSPKKTDTIKKQDIL